MSRIRKGDVPTWFWEALVVFAVLLAVCWYKGFTWPEVVSSLAVLFSFKHAQISDRMAAQQASMVNPDVHCYRWSGRYFLAKEVLWIAFFLMVGSYSAVVGSAVFFVYPFWRKFYTSKKKSK